MDNKHYDLSDYLTDQQAVSGHVEPVVMCNDRARLNSLLVRREMMNNRKNTLRAKTQFLSVDDLYTRISIDEYDELISLSIEALRNRNKAT